MQASIRVAERQCSARRRGASTARIPAMIQRLFNHAAMLVVGIAVGAVLAAGWHGVSSTAPAFATATHGADNFAIATGLVDDGIEALYFLDYLTGDLRAAIVSRRNGEFTGFFQYNVLSDFNQVAEKPRFLMVTGQADIPRGRGATQIGQSLDLHRRGDERAGVRLRFALRQHAERRWQGPGGRLSPRGRRIVPRRLRPRSMTAPRRPCTRWK